MKIAETKSRRAVRATTRRWLLTLVLLGASAGLQAADQPRPPTAGELALFRDAMKNSSQDTEHWAYTESTLIQASKGRPKGETIVRFDPSKPYAEQFTPLKIEGQPPTERQLKEYRRRGERRGERVARAAEAIRNLGNPPPRLRISGQNMTLDLDHPRVVKPVGETHMVFEVPLQGSNKDIPVDKFQIQVLIGKETRQVENVTLLLRESFRVKLIAKVKAGEARMDFTVVDPKFGPVITAMTGNFSMSLLFMPLDATFTRTRTDWQRVKSFDERLKVKLGPLQFPDF
jgi:hypothetical protein